MDGKKISFGFGKTTKKAILQPAPVEKEKDKIEFIDCLEGQSIIIVGKEDPKEPEPLVIPLREEDKTNIPKRLAKLKEIGGQNNEDVKPENETLEQRAAREIMEDLKEKQITATVKENFAISLKPEDLPLDGASEATLDDYESIPIAQFGMAMLRGMGFKEEASTKKKEKLVEEGPIMRPKGMGLGADRMAKQNAPLIAPSKDEVLEMKKGALIKVLTGKHKDSYGMVEGLDEDTGRVFIKFALGGTKDSLNEFMVQLVSKAEYAKYSKILNSQKYEEFKNREQNIKEEKLEKNIKERISSSPEVKIESVKNEYKEERKIPSEKEGRRKNHDRDYERESRPNRHRDEKEQERSRRSYSKSPPPRNCYKEDRRCSPTVDEKDRRTNKHKNDKEHNERSRDTKRSYSNSPSRRNKEDRDRDRDRNNRRSRSNEDDRYHKSSSYKKKSHKYKQRRDRSHNRNSSDDEDDKKHKKKTKRSKKQRSRSRSRR